MVPNPPVYTTLVLPSDGTGSTLPDPNWLDHDRDRPAPPAIIPGTSSTDEKPGRPPSDATVLFDGTDLSKWVSLESGSPTKWIMRDDSMANIA